MAPAGAKQGEDKGVGEVISDLWALVRDYAKQETIDPLTALGGFLWRGLVGSLLFGLGMLFATLAILRVLQSRTGAHLTGSYTWVPYLVALVVDLLVIAGAVLVMKKPVRSVEKAS